jgi:hypothetical protein
MMIEADVSLGTETGSPPKTKLFPVMAHLPDNTSDITLERFIVKVAEVRYVTNEILKKQCSLNRHAERCRL